MTQKELLYLEDACGHEDSIISIIDESLNYLEDEELITFMNNELERHRNIKSELIGLLECVSNSDDSNNDDEDYEEEEEESYEEDEITEEEDDDESIDEDEEDESYEEEESFND